MGVKYLAQERNAAVAWPGLELGPLYPESTINLYFMLI